MFVDVIITACVGVAKTIFKSIYKNKAFAWKCATCMNKGALSPTVSTEDFNKFSQSTCTDGKKKTEATTSAHLHSLTCCFCDDEVDQSCDTLSCSLCHVIMYSQCWDPCLPPQVCTYLTNSNHNQRLQIYCSSCASCPCGTLRDMDMRIKKLEEICATETANHLSYALALKGSSLSTNIPATTMLVSNASRDVGQDIAEAVEIERRKNNIMIFNMAATSTDDAARIEALFEHLTGHVQLFHCERIGISHHGNVCPIIVKFICEDDKREILRHTHKLRDMQAEWPKVNISPDRTKKQQAHFHLLRDECKERRLKGERGDHCKQSDCGRRASSATTCG